jgi:hypothetical protein
MKTLKKIWDWLVKSSADPTKVSLTLKAGIPWLVMLLSWNNLTVDGNAVQVFLDSFVNAMVLIVQVVLGLTTMYAAGRKVVSSVKKV